LPVYPFIEMVISDEVVALTSSRLEKYENNLEPELPVLRLIQLTEGFKSHVIDTD